MKRRTKHKREQPSTREALWQLVDEIADIRRRYEAVFLYARDMEECLASETVPVTLDHDMKAGEIVIGRIPKRFILK